MNTHALTRVAVLLGVTLAATAAVAPAADAGAAVADAREVERVSEVPYLVEPDGKTHVLSVYAPTAAGPWPTAVMIHGGGGGLGAGILEGWAGAVAAEGAVVFVPYHYDQPVWPSAEVAVAEVGDTVDQLACAVRFARAEAGAYGGDAAELSLFGHSSGAHFAALIALTDPAVPPGCLAGADSATPGQLALFEGDWLLMGLPVYDPLLAEDRALWDALTPWSHLEDAPRLPVTIFDSDDPSMVIHTSERIDSLLALRDPDGAYRDRLAQAGALADEQLSVHEVQHLLADELGALGYPVSFVDLPDSEHEHLSDVALAMLTHLLVSGPTAAAAE